MRVEVDRRETYNPGWKFADWEQKGVPLRIELGPKDLQQEQVVFARRDDLTPSGKRAVKWSDVVKEAKEMVRKLRGINHRWKLSRVLCWRRLARRETLIFDL